MHLSFALADQMARLTPSRDGMQLHGREGEAREVEGTAEKWLPGTLSAG
jgi:hypothetical protein